MSPTSTSSPPDTSSPFQPSHALIPLPWWQRGCKVGDWGLGAGVSMHNEKGCLSKVN